MPHAFVMCSSGSHVFSSWGKPFHLIRNSFCPALRWTFFTSSTLCSSFPLIISGGGWGLVSFWIRNCGSWASLSFDSWNMLCIVDLTGSSNLYADFPTVDRTLNGPWNLASSFLDECVVLTFVTSRYTQSPGLYFHDGFTCCLFILSVATSRFFKFLVCFHVCLNFLM